jgi:hypothetical protein
MLRFVNGPIRVQADREERFPISAGESLVMRYQEFVNRQHDFTRQIFQAFYEALRKQIEAGGPISQDRIDSIYQRFNAYWPQVLPAMEQTCNACVAAYERKFTPDSRRKNYVTRLLLSRLVVEIAPRTIPSQSKPFPQLLGCGVAQVIHEMFTESEFGILNDQIVAIYQQAGTDDDAEFWRIVRENGSIASLVDRVFVQCMLRFKSFQYNRRIFMDAMRRGLSDIGYDFTDIDFCEVFAALFGPYFQLLERPKGVVALNLMGGEGCGERVQEVWAAFSRFQQGIASAPRGAGAVPSALRPAAGRT